jgi:hypothetical protein
VKARGLGAALVVLVGLTSRAEAYCSATSCDSRNPAAGCGTDPKTQCPTGGKPLSWRSNCVTFSVQKDAAPSAGISYPEARASVERAIAAWTSVDCGGEPPSLRAVVSEPISCDVAEYNRERKNANLIVFREGEWPYEGGEDALGVTRVRFDAEGDVGALWDTDIELNAVTEPLSAGDPQANQVDLDSLLTHELGHALGLAHSLDVLSSMVAGYETGSVALRSLGNDDVAGVCALYPPSREPESTSCEPRHGFSELCAADQSEEPSEPPATDDPASSSCALVRPAGEPFGSALAALLALSLLTRRKTRSGSTGARDSV